MADTQAAPVAAGLAAGIVLVALFASLFGSTAPADQRLHVELSIEGLKDRYSVGEQINFVVRAAGYGTVCAYPFVKVIDLDRGGSVIFSTAEKGVFLPVCDPDPHSFEQTWPSSQLGIPDPLTLDKIGHYKIVANFGGAKDEDTLSWITL
ncbi:MAG: hypothetical protein QXJ74_02355 [Nitrososphaera sp.]